MAAEGWLSVSDLAAEQGVSKQAISKRLKAFGGRVPSRKDGRSLLIDRAAYLSLVGAETDPAQALRNRNNAPRKGDGPAPASASASAQTQDGLAAKVYSVQRAKREGYIADMARLKLESQSGRWVEAAKAQQAWAKELASLINEIESFIVNRLARELAEKNGLAWKPMAVHAREMFRAFRAKEAERVSESNNGITD